MYYTIKFTTFTGACLMAMATIELLYSKDWLLAFVCLVFGFGFSVINTLTITNEENR